MSDAKNWTCFNCEHPDGRRGVEFAADRPICPNCKLEGADAEGVIVARVTVHFLAPHPILRGRGHSRRPCDNGPTTSSNVPGHESQSTPEPAHVNCPGCRATEAFKTALAERGTPVAVESSW